LPRRSVVTGKIACRKARAAFLALTPPLGRGKRQSTEEAIRQSVAETVLSQHRVMGLLAST
jgi:hypothetical protein